MQISGTHHEGEQGVAFWGDNITLNYIQSLFFPNAMMSVAILAVQTRSLGRERSGEFQKRLHVWRI